VPGIGPIAGSAAIASVGNAKQFKNGRQMAAWIGPTPKQYASGDISRISEISKRGNQTLRRLFIHGAVTNGRRLTQVQINASRPSSV